jgi:hypothetical protein
MTQSLRIAASSLALGSALLMNCQVAQPADRTSVAPASPPTQPSAAPASASTVPAEPSSRPATAAAESAAVSGRDVILSRTSHRQDRGVYFSFAKGVRAGTDADRRVGDVVFEGDQLRAQKHTGDRSTIVDLGERTWAQVEKLPPVGAKDVQSVAAAQGHVYLAHVDDTVVDFFALMRVIELVPGDRCGVEWMRVDASAQPPPPFDPGVSERLVGLLRGQDDNVDPAAFMREPRVLLQLRAGAGGGNPNRVDMLGKTSIYVREHSERPLSFDRPVDTHDRSAEFHRGGRVPPGSVFVVTRVRYAGTAKGDSNGHGEVIVNVGRERIVSRRDTAEPVDGIWDGRVEIRPGQEREVYVEVANSSTAEVVFEGEIVNQAPGRAGPATKP